jgi:acetoin utilization deacetylase AcuC-like enzyme
MQGVVVSVIVVTSDRFADHLTPPGHPERVERAEVMQLVASGWAATGGTVVEPRNATDDDLRRVHAEAHIRTIGEARGRAAMIDADTFMSPESDDVARLGAGAVLTAVDHVLASGAGTRAVALVRPPGHHAEAGRAMGFCLYNNVAVGAAYARARGLERVAILDYDVHHGNGTQWIFYEDPAVLFVSSHQYPFYPGTGAAGETGKDAGLGFTVNFPLEAGATDADLDLVYREAAIPVLRQFRPQIIFVSAGFDAHERDPLGGLRMTTEGYATLTSRLLNAADELCEGRVVFVTEGGYDTSALAECCERVIELAAARAVSAPSAIAGDTRRGERTLTEFGKAHRSWSTR